MAARGHQDTDSTAAEASGAAGVPSAEVNGSVARLVRKHLLPFLFVLYVIAYLDRINIGFAALTMNQELGLGNQQYGLLTGIFFWGYFLFEVPSNLMLERLGARVWIARILVSWGLVSLATAFARTAQQLYLARFLLGVAEAGFFPGILMYLTYWFRQRDMAQAIGLFMTALPTASIIGGPLSGWILDHAHGFGLSSWRWVLILEALPAIMGGVLCYLMLPNNPDEARFLTPAHKAGLIAALRAESGFKPSDDRCSVLTTLRNPRVLYLAAVAFLFMVGNYVTGFWMPQSIKAVGHGLSHIAIGLLVMVPNLVGLCAMVLVSRSSTRRGECHGHAALSLLAAAGAFCFVGTAATLPVCITLWSLATSGLYGFIGPFWSMPGQFLAGRAAAVALAAICSIGNLAGFVGLTAIGAIASRPDGLAQGFHFIALSLTLGAALLIAQRMRHRSLAPGRPLYV
jgi:MFS transporter, ACS family, tartrate transporter